MGQPDCCLLLAATLSAERWECSAKCEIPVEPERFELIVILEGAGSFAWPESAARYHRGECWLVPASTGAHRRFAGNGDVSDPDLCAGHSCNADRIASRWDFSGGASTSYFRLRLPNDGERKN